MNVQTDQVFLRHIIRISATLLLVSLDLRALRRVGRSKTSCSPRVSCKRILGGIVFDPTPATTLLAQVRTRHGSSHHDGLTVILRMNLDDVDEARNGSSGSHLARCQRLRRSWLWLGTVATAGSLAAP